MSASRNPRPPWRPAMQRAHLRSSVFICGSFRMNKRLLAGVNTSPWRAIGLARVRRAFTALRVASRLSYQHVQRIQSPDVSSEQRRFLLPLFPFLHESISNLHVYYTHPDGPYSWNQLLCTIFHRKTRYSGLRWTQVRGISKYPANLWKYWVHIQRGLQRRVLRRSL